jgi:hypothetical protein
LEFIWIRLSMFFGKFGKLLGKFGKLATEDAEMAPKIS